ncbi:MAG: hypothetical protein AYK19_06330 [Theionarchaea archaeon DG-70-1]|nr:MAG: hypothetical protein AYK19_06330 [Theionarchaea archaeon DG-70-1]
MNESVDQKKLGIYPFDTDKLPALSEVGGKGLSLIIMTQRGLSVPPGVVLSVSFFEPWLSHVKKTPVWEHVQSSDFAKEDCDALKKVCMGLQLDDVQKNTLLKSLKPLRGSLFSVRSSSPEEDLKGASFAGGYETTLGVTEDALEEAIKRSFASLFDQRVFLYKKEHGFDVNDPKIAIIVQEQVASDTAGAAFSLNPVNNCYDEAVITANYGLGEPVVSGRVTPDTFVVDKVSHTILEKKQGKKEISMWLSPEGGTHEEPGKKEMCLSDENVLTITDMVTTVEEYYKMPIDIEWAFSGGTLYVLQARPITAYIPLPEEMITPPGEHKRLYIDVLLAKQGIHESMSILGADYMDASQRVTFAKLMGTDALLGVDSMAFVLGGRGYANFSIMAKLMGKGREVSAWRAADALLAEILENVDEKEYIPRKLPPQLRGIVFRILLNNLDGGLKAIKVLINSSEYKKWFFKETEKFLKDLEDIKEKEFSLKEMVDKTNIMLSQYLTHVSLPVLYASEVARYGMKRIFKNEPQGVRDKLVYLERALPENITIEMGMAMYDLSRYKEVLECSSGEEFAQRIREQSFSKEFLSAYNSFMDKYGARCPRELDVATPRLYEQPATFFEQLHIIGLNTDAALDPHTIFSTSKKEREEAYEEFLKRAQKKGWLASKLFQWFYHILVAFGGYREIHKYYIIMGLDMFRQRVLAVAHALVEEGRLDSVGQVFDLTINDLDNAKDPSLDLRLLAEKNTKFLKKIKHIRDFPRLIDSRGKIFHPPQRAITENELVGQPISPGIVRGPVKVLHTPDEKPVLPGDILVARATDPGWTPLFINAGGIILEVGGLLQHGALVAREYGKPCIAGIENVTSLFTDGQTIEMDGLTGVVQLIKATSS